MHSNFGFIALPIERGAFSSSPIETAQKCAAQNRQPLSFQQNGLKKPRKNARFSESETPGSLRSHPESGKMRKEPKEELKNCTKLHNTAQ
jgi:hypothetical protein